VATKGRLGEQVSMLVILFHTFGVISCGLAVRFWYLSVQEATKKVEPF
jgi:hypothetical protein